MPTIASPPPPVPSSVPVPVDTIPFTLRGQHVLVRALVDGKPAVMILDTGSSTSTLSTQWTQAHPVRLLPSPVPVKGTADLQVSLGTVDALQLGNTTLRNETVAVLPLDAVSAAHGIPIDGTIGYALFARYVVEVDYSAHVLRLYEPDTYVMPNGGTALPVDLAMRIPIVRARLAARGRSAIDARLVIDLGTSGLAVILTSPFRRAHASDFPLDAGIELPLGTGVGGATHGRVVRLASVQLGGLSFSAPTAGYSDTGSGFLGVDWADGTVGAPVLSRGTLIVDYPHRQVILLPRGNTAEPFAYDASGLTLTAVAPSFDEVRVEHVVADSPASDAGVRSGDVLIALDGKPVTGSSLDLAHAGLRDVGAERVLDLTRAGQKHQVRIRLRELVR
jgi:hypothetical protein